MLNQHVKQLLHGRIAARVVIATTITLTLLVGCEKSEPAATLVPPTATPLDQAHDTPVPPSPTMTITATPNPTQTSIPPSPTMTMTATLVPPSPTMTMTATTAPPVLFSLEKSTQSFPSVPTVQIGLGDLDGDGDLDAVFANGQSYFSTVWLNDGNGHFTDSGQQLTQQGHGVGVGDLDGDGDLDLFLTCHGTGNPGADKPSRVYLNDGHGVFYDSGQDLGDTSLSGNAVNLADIDVDGDLDAIVAYYERDNWVYLNDGQANFNLSEMTFPTNSAWGDLDSDGDVDVFFKEDGVGYQAMLNDGTGDFNAHWVYQDTIAMIHGDIGLGDVDNDGDLDAIVTNGDWRSTGYPALVLLNDGTGQFVDSGQKLGAVRNAGVSLGDLTGDGYLDLVFTDFERPNQVWFNDGAGQFIDSGFRFGADEFYRHAHLADLDQDGDLDIFLATFGIDRGPNEIWFNAHSSTQTLSPWQPITVENAERLQLLRTMKIPGYQNAQVSQCNVAFSPDSSLLVGAWAITRFRSGKCRGGNSCTRFTTHLNTSSPALSTRVETPSPVAVSTRALRPGTR